ncbi:MAG: SDR family oxidoreductase [Rhodobacteraceae bacterium]|nr:SDR family oxidoreductase [Paracoccaceae bacterium]
MSNTALITGASSGIGKEFARYHAAKGGDLIITARREDALNALKAELEAAHRVSVHVIAADLGAADGPQSVYDGAKATGLLVDVLINNAGFGGHGLHIERDLAAEMAMIDLNVKSLVSLTHMVANDMVKQGGGKILNVGSTAGMIPGPLQAVYFATKAFVQSFSLAIDEELRDRGVTCTVLAPGAVKTEFFDLANLDGTNLGNSSKSAESVAKIGYDAMTAGKLHVINETGLNFMLNWIVPLLPRRRVLKMVRGMQTKN